MPEEEEAFALFFADLQTEVAESEEDQVTEEEARELFLLMKDEFNEVMSTDLEDLGLQGMSMASVPGIDGETNENPMSVTEPQREFSSTSDVDAVGAKGQRTDIEKSVSDDGMASLQGLSPRIQQAPTYSGGASNVSPAISSNDQAVGTVEADEFWSQITDELGMDTFSADGKQETVLNEVVEQSDHDIGSLQSDFYVEELRKVLPTFSDKRLRRIKRAFMTSLSDPSLLDLVPLVRERMPDYITATWLKQMSAMTARFVLYKAVQEDVVDTHVLNGVLELVAAAGSLDRALEFYETEFDSAGLKPTEVSIGSILDIFFLYF